MIQFDDFIHKNTQYIDNIKYINIRIYSVNDVCKYVNTRERTTLKRNAYNEIYSDNSLNIYICLATASKTDRSH